MKYCGKCRQRKELTEYWNDKSEKDGRARYCKTCFTAYKGRIPKPKAKNGHYICAICKIEKPLNLFGKNRAKKNGHHCYCKQCIKEKYGKKKDLNTFLCSQCLKKKNMSEYNDFAVCNPCKEEIIETGEAKRINIRVLDLI